ncbi:MnmC family methyltransferase [Niabella ginsengisoli]|uniref:MnmC family methyltransferase n=1 Tax=Niabella ginsengisoli TaxID=522298 RepID=A0ABS9SH15_9BACT|nr:MnmC family methyltransferase [Niabella ginsengisoli]MCH5597652.1 MnmC family methyltransferase [Niabella ginsengisoli]
MNALLTATTAARFSKNVLYHAIELNPLPAEVYSKLNYSQILKQPELYKAIMQTGWEQMLFISPFFKLKKINDDLLKYLFTDRIDIIYFDPFAPEDQSEIWSDTIYEKMFNVLNNEGILMTYCSKSVVRKALQQAGFAVEKLQGPRGKREIVRAVK